MNRQSENQAGTGYGFFVTLANEFVKDKNISANNLFALENICSILLRKNIPATRKIQLSLKGYVEKYKSILDLQGTEKYK